MNSDAASSRRPSVTVRLTPDEKRRFATIAAARGQSESELGLAAVRVLLELNANQIPPAASAMPKESASDRITIRLRPGDRQTIAERARQRSTKASTYIAALVRAHVRRAQWPRHIGRPVRSSDACDGRCRVLRVPRSAVGTSVAPAP